MKIFFILLIFLSFSLVQRSLFSQTTTSISHQLEFKNNVELFKSYFSKPKRLFSFNFTWNNLYNLVSLNHYLFSWKWKRNNYHSLGHYNLGHYQENLYHILSQKIAYQNNHWLFKSGVAYLYYNEKLNNQWFSFHIDIAYRYKSFLILLKLKEFPNINLRGRFWLSDLNTQISILNTIWKNGILSIHFEYDIFIGAKALFYLWQTIKSFQIALGFETRPFNFVIGMKYTYHHKNDKTGFALSYFDKQHISLGPSHFTSFTITKKTH